MVFLAAYLIATLYQATLTPANADTGIYHAQAIRWIGTYPAVPGLTNFHQRLGNAVFGLSFLNLQSFHLLTGVFILIMLFLISKGDKISETLFVPAAYPAWSSEPCEFGNFKLLCQAAYDSCWYSPFPCAVRGDPEVEMRGKDYRDGFRYGSAK